MTGRESAVPRAKVLLAVADAEGRMALEKALDEAGYEVMVAASGSFAITMVEWQRPDVVVSGAHVEDMDGYELFSLMRNDPATMGKPFLLLAGRDRSIALAAAEAGVDAAMTGDFTVEMVVGRVGELLTPKKGDQADRQEARVEPAGGRSLQSLWQKIEAAGPALLEASAGAFQGSLGAIELTEIVQAIALGGKTGCLILSLSAGQGAILFDDGQILHAGFCGSTGEEAFAALMSAAQGDPQARFCFNRADRAAVAHLPKTIFRGVDQLLLSIATSVDETRGDHPILPDMPVVPETPEGE
jgi:CheY-like chemotaxis protein